MMDDILSLERRTFLQAAGTVAITAAGATSAAAADQKTLVIFQAGDSASVAFAGAMQAKGMRVLAIGDDPVRLWRDELRALVVDEGYRLMGRTQYPVYFILRGLAAEHRLFPQHEHHSKNSSFDWVI